MEEQATAASTFEIYNTLMPTEIRWEILRNAVGQQVVIVKCRWIEEPPHLDNNSLMMFEEGKWELVLAVNSPNQKNLSEVVDASRRSFNQKLQ